jgi:serine/threonine protein kinase
MAPEQLRGEPAEERSDLYSLAIVLYEMLAGSSPFPATSDHELFQAQLHTKPRRLRELLPEIDPRVDAALMRALAKKPSQRFGSIAEFKYALDADSARRGAHGSLHRTMQMAARALPAAHAKLSGLSDKLLLTLSPALRARLERIPPKTRLPLMAGATALIAGLIAWGALMLNQGSLAANEPSAAVVVRTPDVQKPINSSVIMAEPELHAGRVK